MMARSFILLLLAATAAPAADTQTTLDALLAEVRELRIAVQRAAAVSPRLQVAMRRLDWQEQRVARASEQLADIRKQLASHSNRQSELAGHLKTLEAEALQAAPDHRKAAINDRLASLKPELEQLSRMEIQLRAREAEVASDLRTEQAKADELAGKMENLERALTPPVR